MALLLTYNDAYLKTRVTEDIEDRALLDVDNLGDFPDTPINWRERLGVLRSYIITCLELGADSDDVFAQKLKQYRVEFDYQLVQARNAAALADSTNYTPLTSISIERA
ncbi:MAG: hypothetical protein KGZ88_11880 [Methylomicrobium sp.]|nr:hypothetical protein [Methylomicrobium sp.]